MKNDYAQISTSLNAGYTVKNLKAGVEFNKQKNNRMINGYDFSGISAYTSIGFAGKFGVYIRYDYLKSVVPDDATDPWNKSKDGQLIITGFDYSPAIGVKIAPTFLGWLPYDKTKSLTSTIALNIEIKI